MRPIEVGDLVQVVRCATCCGHDKGVGYIFVVGEIHDGPSIECTVCMQLSDIPRAFDARRGWVPIARLKRIPPLEELKHTDIREEVEA